MQEAFDIFGDVGDLLEIYDQRKREEADGVEEEQEPDFSDEEAAETFRVEQVQACEQGQSCCHTCSSVFRTLPVARESSFLSVVCLLLQLQQVQGRAGVSKLQFSFAC